MNALTLVHCVHRDFLPRGSGVVTRRPLVLQLYSIPPSTSAGGSEGQDTSSLDGSLMDSEHFYALDDESGGHVTGRSGRRGHGHQ